ncbi:MAG TPA: RNase adapter RapZ [Thermohalobaculum sp.]|nr:RNase adapter RapZ [Thermohalobaculum sp.]
MTDSDAGAPGQGGGQAQGAAAAPPLAVIVTGMSGAGRTTAINALEDLGFEALNNFPLSLIERLVEPSGTADAPGPVAIGVETRTRGFSARALTAVIDRLRERRGGGAVLVFLDCADSALVSRFSQTRRRHPLSPAEDPATGIARERGVLAEVRARADVVIDTTDLNPNALRAEVERRFSQQIGAGLTLSVQSFSYKRGAPSDADMVLDCRFLRNPYWQAELRELDGRHARIQGFVGTDPLFEPFFEKLCELLLMLLPAYKAEGKAYFCVALGCTGGRHRSVTVSELLAARLREAGWPVALRHREIEQTPGAGAAGGPGMGAGTEP